jgi:hypothetical protein
MAGEESARAYQQAARLALREGHGVDVEPESESAADTATAIACGLC